jgi:hypothetical protein
MAGAQDPRKTFVVDTIAGAIAPVPDQKVNKSHGFLLQQAAAASTDTLLRPCSGCLCRVLGAGRQWGNRCFSRRCNYKLAAGEAAARHD